MPIRKLSPLLVSQIAAGEVIERPASVVKELVENALDAGARSVRVRVEEGGRELIRVADDGAGIPADQLAMALEPHATSKIAEADDLAAIATMGFRGEALASIASVSRVTLTSRTPDAAAGAKIEMSGDQRGEPRPDGCAPGTVIEVRNLFFNTPARRKFMRSAATEFGHIHDTLGRIAVARPAVAFQLTHNSGRSILDLPPDQTPRDRCLAQLGVELDEAMLEFDSDERGVKIWGLAALPSLARSTTKHQYVYVNGRPVRDRNIIHAAKEAYRGLIEPNRHPTIVLFLTLDPATVDVNVHPAKSEVRFADGSAVHGQVLASLRQRLLAADLTPAVNFSRSAAPPGPPSIDPSTLPLAASQAPDAPEREPAPDSPLNDPNGSAPAPTIGSVGDFVDYFRRMDPHQKGVVYGEVQRAMNGDTAADGDGTAGPADSAAAEDRDPRLAEPIRSAQSILQVHDSYIVTQDEAGIVIIDQHALHERMMFERLQERIRSRGRLESQRLITPATLPATPGRIDLLDRLTPLLEKIGVEAEAMGPTTIGVHAFPTLLFDRGLEPGPFLDALLDRAEADGFEPTDEATLHEVLDMMSCKAAVKAGDHMQPDELNELLRRRDDIERASNCPHGRPTTVRLTLRDLEKHFKRS